MGIKIFHSDISTDDLENKISDWVNDLKPKIISTNVSVNVVNDYYANSAPAMVCNTWYEYICSIVYENNSKSN